MYTELGLLGWSICEAVISNSKPSVGTNLGQVSERNDFLEVDPEVNLFLGGSTPS